MKIPKTQTAEVLYELIKQGSITRASILNSCGVLNVTARIADLRIRHGLEINCTKVHVRNKFNREISYGKWSINPKNIQNAKDLYLRINK